MSRVGGSLCQGNEGVYVRGRRESISGEGGSLRQWKEEVYIKGGEGGGRWSMSMIGG